MSLPAESMPPPTDRWPLATVLVVDDEPGMRNFLVKTLATRVGQRSEERRVGKECVP